MLVTDFDYDLPESRIAKFPPRERGTTRLLVLDRQSGQITDSRYSRLADFLQPGDVLVLNDTKVQPARLLCTLPDGRARELVVLEKHGAEPDQVLYRGKLHPGDELTPKNNSSTSAPRIIITEILGGGIAKVCIKAQASHTPTLLDLTKRYGIVPLPPYLHRNATTKDQERYQTVWAKHIGSAAAPTASLNMTKTLLRQLSDRGIHVHYLTLHVGLGTFLPMRTNQVEDHHMHSEWFHIPENTLNAIRAAHTAHRRVVALGTTVARTLEFYGQTGQTSGEDDIFIYPGYNFQVIDALITNFHAPRSTVLMLAAAFAGWDHLLSAYQHALRHKYNFLSYGDSMLIC